MRSFHVCTALFALGIFSAQFSPTSIPAWAALAALACLAPCCRLPRLRPWLIPWACLAAGVLWALWRADLVLGTEWPGALESKDVTLWGTVAELPERSERYLKFDLDVERARYRGRPVPFTGRARLRWYDAPPEVAEQLRAATTWRLRARLKQPHGYYNPGGFDYEAYLFREGVRASGYVREAAGNTRTDTAPGSWLLSARQALRDRLEISLEGASQPGLLKALALGDRSAVSDDAWATLRATGTNHLIAISGLHIGFVAGIGALLGMAAGRLATIPFATVSAPRVAAGAALCFAFAYAALSGFAVPAQRAFVMAAVFLVGVLCRRHAWNVRTLCVALVAVLLLDPAAVHDPGFWLSFGAVALIMGWLTRERRREEGTGDGVDADAAGTPASTRWQRLRGRALAALKLQWVLSLALLPLVVAFFGVASLVAAPANTVAVPVVVFALVPLCLAAVVAAALGLPGAAAWCLGMADVVLTGLWSVLEWLAGLPGARVEAHLELWQSIALLVGLMWLILARAGRRRWGLAACLVLLAPAPSAPVSGAFRVTVLDVGQGLSVVVRTARHTMVYDTGPRYPGGFSLARAVVIPYLRDRGVDGVDLVVVSHGDNDHRGGYEDLRASYPDAAVLSSVELPGGRYCVRGQRWEWDGVAFEILHPDRRAPPPHNNASCVLRISGPHGSVLLTGDIEAIAEAALVRRAGGRLRSDVLLVPHQGSETSSTPAFVDRVDPRLAVVSAGYLNRYGHPRPAVMERYRSRGIEVRNTARSGAVMVEVSAQGIEMSGWRDTAPRYWLDKDDPEHAREAI